MSIDVIYKGMPCKLFRNYMRENDGPWVMIKFPSDIKKAYEMGFECLGYPDEIAKRITDDEYRRLLNRGEC